MKNLSALIFSFLLFSSQSFGQAIERTSPDCAPEAIAHAQAGAAHEEPLAIYLLARYYSTGKCIHGDGAKALDLYKRAAQLNYPRAFYNLGIVYAGNNDFKGAEEMFTRGAELGHRGSELQLGILYSLVPAPVGDHVKAVAWLSLTASRSESISNEAKDVLKSIKTRMEPAVWGPASILTEELKAKYGSKPEFKE